MKECVRMRLVFNSLLTHLYSLTSALVCVCVCVCVCVWGGGGTEGITAEHSEMCVCSHTFISPHSLSP